MLVSSTFSCIYLTIDLLNMVFHSVGFYLLLRCYRSSNRTVQHLCITNFALSLLTRIFADIAFQIQALHSVVLVGNGRFEIPVVTCVKLFSMSKILLTNKNEESRSESLFKYLSHIRPKFVSLHLIYLSPA